MVDAKRSLRRNHRDDTSLAVGAILFRSFPFHLVMR